MYKINDILNSLGMILLGVILFGAGFYFGGKTTAATLTKEFQATEKISNFAQSVTAEPSVEASTKGVEIPGVYWIRVGQPPVCPETHPIKGKFGTNANVYYLTDNKSYAKVKAEICFTDENFAVQSAGFIRKY